MMKTVATCDRVHGGQSAQSCDAEPGAERLTEVASAPNWRRRGAERVSSGRGRGQQDDEDKQHRAVTW